jgi:hypothetical protein
LLQKTGCARPECPRSDRRPIRWRRRSGSRAPGDHLARPLAPRLAQGALRGAAGVAERLLAQLPPGAALVTVGDFHPASLSWLGAVADNAIVWLGVDRFWQLGDIPDLYRAYGIDTDPIFDAVARACLRVMRQTE